MPKSSKKRKDKAADFSKAKLKLGKGKKLADNAIDTSFKARSIALPSQSIAVEKSDAAPTTRRKLNFDDLVSHAKHHNAGTRKDAILGMRELLDGHPQLLDSTLTQLLNACVRIIGDEDASVRKILLQFFTWLLPHIPKESLVPHSPMLLLFTTSAQTHIFPEIRIDAIRFLDLFMENIPETITAGWSESNNGHGSRVLEGYLGIMNAGTKFGGEADGPMKATSTASVVLSPASKLIVLKSLSKFLKNAIASPHNASPNGPTSTTPTWYLGPSFASPEAYDTFVRLLKTSSTPSTSTTTTPFARKWQPEADLDSFEEDFVQNFPFGASSLESQWTLQQLSDVVGTTGSLAGEEASHAVDFAFISHLARTLKSTIIDTFLDCAPAVFTPNTTPPETEVHMVVAIVEITRSLYGAILQGTPSSVNETAAEDLRILLSYMMTYFPFRPTGSTRDVKLEQSFQDLNLVFCELTSLLVLAATTAAPARSSRAGKARQTSQNAQAALSIQTERVSKYVVQLLRSEAQPGQQIARSLSAPAYTALLPTIWSLINNPSPAQLEISSRVLQATVEHSIKASTNSALKRSALEFVARVIMLTTEQAYQGNFRVGRNLEEDKKFAEWIQHLPQTLWELGANHLATTEMILRFLLRFFQRKTCLLTETTLAAIRSRLVPYFSISHAVRGQVPGPFTKLPQGTPLRRLVLDVLATTGAPDEAMEAAVSRAVAGTLEDTYWIELKSMLV